MMNHPLPVPFFAQSADGYCLPACVRMVLAYHQVDRSEMQLRRMLGARPYGTPSFAVQRLTIPGIRVDYREWTIQELSDLLERENPLIVFLRTGFLDYWRQDVAHAVVVVGVETSSRYWVHDPALSAGPVSTAWHGLLAAWGEFAFKGALLSRT